MTARPHRLVLALLACACDVQVDSGYLGEPLAVLPGYVTGTPPTAPVEAAMLWQRGPPPSYTDVELATRAPVSTAFPASFTLRLYQPPPAAALRTLAAGEVAFARANAAAIPYGIAPAGIGALPTAGNTGSYTIDPAHWIVHLAAPVPPDSLMEWWLGAALPRGYALLKVTEGCPTPDALAACIAELRRRGVPEDGSGAPGTAGAYCRAPYRLAPAPAGEQLVLVLGTPQPPPPGTCP